MSRDREPERRSEHVDTEAQATGLEAATGNTTFSSAGAIPPPKTSWVTEPGRTASDAAYGKADQAAGAPGEGDAAMHQHSVQQKGPLAAWDDSMSDGCTLAPDGSWRQACVDHDRKYYYGGSAADRLKADHELKQDMIKLGASAAVASAYFLGVRIGGRPGTGLPWEWGYGAHKKK